MTYKFLMTSDKDGWNVLDSLTEGRREDILVGADEATATKVRQALENAYARGFRQGRDEVRYDIRKALAL